MQEIGVEHFVRRLKHILLEKDGHFAFFLGAGCSIGSGIPGAKSLVEQWLSQHYTQMTGRGSPNDEWLKAEFPKHDLLYPGASYASVMRRLFQTPVERQREIERIVKGQDPDFSYAVFAKLITHEQCARQCNLVLTTNFDDLVADALYLYTQQKPLVIVHQSLVGFVETGRTRPLVIKLHGDALLEPRNTEDETRELDPAVCQMLCSQLLRRGLIFTGYGGNDTGVANLFKAIPEEALSWGIYWINDVVPDNEFGHWLQSRSNSVWVRHVRFDELMVLVRAEFGLAHPDETRFGNLMETYRKTFEKLTQSVAARPVSEEKGALTQAVEKATGEAKDWWSFHLKARALWESDPDQADRIYRSGTEKLKNSANLLGMYAIFLMKVRKEYDRAEALLRQALTIDPNNAANLGNLAILIKKSRKDFDEAERLYRRAIECDPKRAELLGAFALFLSTDRKDFVQAESFYRAAIELAPTHANSLGNFAGFLLAKGDGEGLKLVARALRAADGNSQKDLLAECYFYLYAHEESGRSAALQALHSLLREGVRSPGWDFSRNIERAEMDGHPNVPLLKALAAVIADEAPLESLEYFAEWRNAALPISGIRQPA